MLWTLLCRIQWWRLRSASGALSPFKPLYKQGRCLGLCQPLCSEPGAHRGSGWVEKSTTPKQHQPVHGVISGGLEFSRTVGAKEFILVTHRSWVVESQWPRGASHYCCISLSLCGQIWDALFSLIYLSIVIINAVRQSAASLYFSEGSLATKSKCSMTSSSHVADSAGSCINQYFLISVDWIWVCCVEGLDLDTMHEAPTQINHPDGRINISILNLGLVVLRTRQPCFQQFWALINSCRLAAVEEVSRSFTPCILIPHFKRLTLSLKSWL